ncbi:MAG: isopentenyl-diphosphate Delta-isomerase [Myxococcota bacterium]|nr:isopentenyl-diphosphate Delta-isomerase [Myxococcota bacterium]
MEEVILVDEQDREIGTCEKLRAHQDGGRLHRAFSIFLFDSEGRMWLQQRAAGKYHFPDLWTNACCSHPRPGEPVAAAVKRRLREELGCETALEPAFDFVYRASDPASGLTEHEFDHVWIGTLDAEPDPDPEEVQALERQTREELLADLEARPGRYTPWFRIAVGQLEARGLLSR